MSWKASFHRGVREFKASNLDEALIFLTKAIAEKDGDKQYILYDSRAAIYEKLGRLKEALQDTKIVINLAGDQWQGYARAARLFFLTRKFDASLTMVNMSMERINPQNTKRRVEMSKLKDEVIEAQEAIRDYKRLTRNHSTKLPVELLGEIFHLIIEEDSTQLISMLRVSHHWRNVVLHMPSLWNTLILTQRAPTQKLRLWIDRSRGGIRRLQIRSGATRHLDWPFRQLEDLPWNKLRVCKVEAWDVASYVQKLAGSPKVFGELEELVVGDNRCDTSISPLLFPLLQASKIRSLAFTRAQFSWKTACMHLGNITALKVLECGTDPESLLPTLEAHPSLETFILHTPLSYKWSSTHTSQLSLLHLTHLELGGSWASSLLEVIAMPSLEILYIRGASGSLDRALVDATNRSTKLKELVIDHCSVTPSVLLNFIRQTHHLTNLGLLSLSQGANHIVEALEIPLPDYQTDSLLTGGPNILCPALTHLNVSHSPDVRTGPLVRLVKSRIPVELHDNHADSQHNALKCSQLISLMIDGCELVEADWIPWFRKNVQFVSCVYMTKKKAAWKR